MSVTTPRTVPYAQPARCECGQSFPPTLAGSWAAREHLDATQHKLHAA